MTKELEERLASLEKELLQVRAETPAPSRAKHALANHWKWYAIALVLLCTILISILLLGSRGGAVTQADNKAIFSSVLGNTDFDFYYPESLPQGYKIIPNSLNVQSSIISYTISTPSAGTLVVTQQKRPPVMEKIKVIGKSGLQDPSNGTYVADLEGNYTGMFVTDKTLLLVSGSQKSELDQLNAIIASQVKL